MNRIPSGAEAGRGPSRVATLGRTLSPEAKAVLALVKGFGLAASLYTAAATLPACGSVVVEPQGSSESSGGGGEPCGSMGVDGGSYIDGGSSGSMGIDAGFDSGNCS